ncbi:hypothetical protein ACLKA6_012751, partial [Drosophila palustris]
AQLKGLSSAPHKVDSGEIDGVKLFHNIIGIPINKYSLVYGLIIKYFDGLNHVSSIV